MNAIAPSFMTPVSTNLHAQRARDAVARYVEGLYDVASQHRMLFSRKWDEYYQFYCGQQWKFPQFLRVRNDWRAAITVNRVLPLVEADVAVIMDSRPKITVSATSPWQQPYAQTNSIMVDSIWARRKTLRKLEDGIKSSDLYGIGYLKLYWNPELDNGRGDVDCEHVPSEYLYPDPGAKDFDESMRFVLEVKPVPMSYIRERWPDLAHLVKPDADRDGGGYAEMKNDQRTLITNGYDQVTPLTWLSPVGDNPQIASQTEYSAPPYRRIGSRERWCRLIECWVRDPAEEEVTETVLLPGPQGGVVPHEHKRTVKKYPYGRLIHCAGGVTLDDNPVEVNYPGFGPYVRIIATSKPSEFFGIGIVEMVRDLQIEHNRRVSQMADYATLFSNGIWILDTTSQVKKEMVGNRPGLIIYKAPGSTVERLPPPQMPPSMPMMADRPANDMMQIAGMGGVMSGAPPRGARSGSAMEAAHNIATLRSRSRGRNVEYAVEHAGRIILALIARYYTYPRAVRVVGDSGLTYFVPYDGRQARDQWDVKVEAGSMSPTARAAEEQKYIQLYQMQAIDRRCLLEKLQIPEREDVLRRMGDPLAMVPQSWPGWPGAPKPGSATGYATAARLAPMPQGPPPGAGPAGPGAESLPKGGGGAPQRVGPGGGASATSMFPAGRGGGGGRR